MLIVALAMAFFSCQPPKQNNKSPKLLVGIVVDQMREDFLFKFYDQYSDSGFKRLVNEGFVCRNTHFNYSPTITAVGHTSIYAGTTPKYHGIIGNSWYRRDNNKVVYCVNDEKESVIGGKGVGRSPRNLLSTSFADELKMSNNNQSKVISISLKDRAAILSSGHMADQVYWIDLNTGNFVTSSYYTNELPEWVKQFNQRKLAEKYINQKWDLLLPKNTYTNSIADDNRYETIMGGKKHPTFPYDLKEMAPKNDPYFEVLNRSPFGNSILTDLAIEAIATNNLGKGAVTDLFQISYSSTDAIGHTYGPQSKEINDTYVRLDREIARLLSFLDKQVGEGNYSLFLTADHGVGEVPDFLIDHKIPAGELNLDTLRKGTEAYLDKTLGKGNWVLALKNDQFYLNRKLIVEKGLNLADVQNMLATYILQQEGVFEAYTATQLIENEYTEYFASKIQKGFNHQLSGDVKYIMDPGWYSEMHTCATHNSVYAYDSHVPLLFFGKGFTKGASYKHYEIPDIAPTLSSLVKVNFPSATTGKPIAEVLEK